MHEQSNVKSLGLIMGVWAHPDDETFLSAGVMATAFRSGRRPVLVTATDGERGTDRPDIWPPFRLAPVRRRELATAMSMLGVRDLRRLGYPDGGCADVPVDEGGAKVRSLIEEIRPDTILTFGPDGMTGHPDHQAVSAWVAGATRDGIARVLHATVSPAQARRHRDVSELLGAFPTGYPVVTEDDRIAVRLTLDDGLLDRKLAALRAHASQSGMQEAAVGTDAYRTWWPEESFRDAAPAELSDRRDQEVGAALACVQSE